MCLQPGHVAGAAWCWCVCVCVFTWDVGFLEGPAFVQKRRDNMKITDER